MGVAGRRDGTTALQRVGFRNERNAGVRKQFLANLVGPVTRCRQIMTRRCVVDVVMWVGVPEEVPRWCCCQLFRRKIIVGFPLASGYKIPL